MPLVTRADNLPPAECTLGYPWTQLEQIFDTTQLNRLDIWLHGQTVALCEGTAFNHDTREFEERCNGFSHGTVIYTHDLIRFLAAAPIID